MRRLAATVVGALAGVLVLAGCASGAGGPQASGGARGAASPSVPAASAAPSGALRTPLPATEPSGAPVTLAVHRGGAPDAAGPLWSAAGAASADSSVTVQWAGAASAACGAVDGAWVTETSTEVVIALGAHARESGVICPMVLVPHTAQVALSAPLGTRRLLEPSAGCGVPVRTDGGTGRTCPVRPVP